MRIFILSFLISISVPAFAAGSKSQKDKLSFGFAAGMEVRGADGGDGYMQSQSLDLLAVMVGWENNWIQFERSKFNLQTGNASLSVLSKNEYYSLWMTIEQTQIASRIIPFFDFGVGYAASTVKTTVLGVSETDHSQPNFSAGGGLGFRIQIPYVWLSAEARVLMIDGWDPAPTLGAIAKLGFYF